ncbi:CIC11C00000003851 [Sungouiella intermedia]|uniref:CIC11C00000003851 n=1 Tax=Sungouiella intermedia TaxID=45354 RepID=A0A1L0DBZ3_9ASCO|nr:CIC11C00000003851 [[Candida] intermedia]
MFSSTKLLRRTAKWKTLQHLTPNDRFRLLPRQFVRSVMVPPSHFSNPANVPKQYGIDSQSSETNTESENGNVSELGNYPPPPRSERPFRELLSLLAMVALTYLAVDNYTGRVKLEKLNTETTAINLKTLQLQQQNFLNSRKQQELKMLRERMDVSKRCYKMALHIALLRKQLTDLGVDPAEINTVLQEFEKNVRLNNSVQNLTGQAIWLDDNSELSGFVPDYREYDKKGTLEA